MFHFDKTAIWTSEFSQFMTPIGKLSHWKMSLLLIFSSLTISGIRLCARMLALDLKGRTFIEKVNSRCFCWFPAATWRLHTKLYKGGWTVSTNNSETVGHKDLRCGQIVYILVFYNFHFLGFFHWTVSNLFCGPCLSRESENEEFFLTNTFPVSLYMNRKTLEIVRASIRNVYV